MGAQTPYGPVGGIFSVVQLNASEGAHDASTGDPYGGEMFGQTRDPHLPDYFGQELAKTLEPLQVCFLFSTSSSSQRTITTNYRTG